MKLLWDREHNVASIRIAEGELAGQGVDAWQVSDDVVFDIGSDGTVINIQVLDPKRLLVGVATPEEALSRVLGSLATLRAS